MSDIASWLEHLGLDKYAVAFAENDVDLRALPELTDDDLKELGVSLGHRRIIQLAIRDLSRAAEAVIETPPDAGAVNASPGEAERRQLTVMFCDLVGSTALSQSLDVEAYRDVLATYQSAAKKAVERYDGYIARYMGDGLLVYFGYPQAHEEDPERAIHAGLAISDALGALKAAGGIDLKVRVGIATGLVVAGDIVGEGSSEERAVLGETPNLAARLQAVAEPDAVVVSDLTWQLTRGRFDFEPLPPQPLKGIRGPVTAYQAISPRQISSRFAAAHPARLTPLTGRDGELALLLQAWHLAREGEGQVTLIEGEAGIGKSRLTEAASERIESEASMVQRYQCSAYESAVAFHPVTNVLRRLAGIAPRDGEADKLDKLEALVNRAHRCDERTVALIADLLSLPTLRYPALNMTPHRQRAETISVLVDLLDSLGGDGPYLVLFEDAHWSDPSSMEFLDAFVQRIQSRPALAMVTARSQIDARWTGYGHVGILALNRLGKQAVSKLVSDLSAGQTLAPKIVDAIVSRADGVPLFVEELTRSILETRSSELPEEADPREAPAVPPTLRDALLSRLDRLGGAKEIAQIAACIGREFGQTLAAAIAPMPPRELENALARLVDSGLVLRRGQPPDAVYVFKHALIRDIAEESLLRKRNQQIHAKIAKALLNGDVEVGPERLAYHCAKAGQAESAVDFYMQAGRACLMRSAYQEALSHLDAAREILDTLPESETRTRQALSLYSARAEALTAAQGYTADETTAAYRAAYELCEALGASNDIFPLLRGIYNTYNSQGRLRASRDVANRALAAARSQGEPASLSLAYRLLGQNEFMMGEFKPSLRHLNSALSYYDPVKHAQSAERYGLDLKSAPSKYVSLDSWMLGYPDRAKRGLEENLRHGEALGFAFNLALSRMWAYYLPMCMRDWNRARALATSLESLSYSHEIPDCVVAARAQLALLDALQSDDAVVLERASDHLSVYRRTWGEFVVPFNLGTLAMGHARFNQRSKALALIDEALMVIEDTGERWCEAEIWRLKGELSLTETSDEARSCFGSALEVAREQDARSWELRAATSLARMLQSQDGREDAFDLLFPLYDWFTEGSDTPDLQNARALLDELS